MRILQLLPSYQRYYSPGMYSLAWHRRILSKDFWLVCQKTLSTLSLTTPLTHTIHWLSSSFSHFGSLILPLWSLMEAYLKFYVCCVLPNLTGWVSDKTWKHFQFCNTPTLYHTSHVCLDMMDMEICPKNNGMRSSIFWAWFVWSQLMTLFFLLGG